MKPAIFLTLQLIDVIALRDGNKIPTPEDVMESWGRITSLGKPRFFYQLAEMSPEWRR